MAALSGHQACFQLLAMASAQEEVGGSFYVVVYTNSKGQRWKKLQPEIQNSCLCWGEKHKGDSEMPKFLMLSTTSQVPVLIDRLT